MKIAASERSVQSISACRQKYLAILLSLVLDAYDHAASRLPPPKHRENFRGFRLAPTWSYTGQVSGLLSRRFPQGLRHLFLAEQMERTTRAMTVVAGQCSAMHGYDVR